MPFEIDFHPVGTGSSSGDAITMRHFDGVTWRVMVIDGGYYETGDALCDHIWSVYETRHVDHVVSTHPDNDHVGGLRKIFARMTVGSLWMHVPFLHASEILHLFHSSRWTVDGLAGALRRAYPDVTEILNLASIQGTAIYEPFQGTKIGPFTVLSPTKDMYLGLLPQFRDTPRPDQALLHQLGHWLQGIGRRITTQIRNVVREDFLTETLREGGVTAAENESSVVLGSLLDSRAMLLTADAGLRALDTALAYGSVRGFPFGGGLSLFQVPHHGSRNNISPSRLDRLVGPVQALGQRSTACVISAGPEDDTLRWCPFFGQAVKLGPAYEKDGPDDGQAEAVFG